MGIDKITSIYAPPLSPGPLAPGRSSWKLHICAHFSNNNILVIIDRLSKQSIFIPTHDTITSAKLAKLFVIHVFSKHGVPSHITSDQGSEFMSSFFRTLGKALDMKLHFTSSYHPKGDGQIERTNQTLEQYLQIYCNYQHSNLSDLLHSRNSPTTMPRTRPPVFHPSSPTRATI